MWSGVRSGLIADIRFHADQYSHSLNSSFPQGDPPLFNQKEHSDVLQHADQSIHVLMPPDKVCSCVCVCARARARVSVIGGSGAFVCRGRAAAYREIIRHTRPFVSVETN